MDTLMNPPNEPTKRFTQIISYIFNGLDNEFANIFYDIKNDLNEMQALPQDKHKIDTSVSNKFFGCCKYGNNPTEAKANILKNLNKYKTDSIQLTQILTDVIAQVEQAKTE